MAQREKEIHSRQPPRLTSLTGGELRPGWGNKLPSAGKGRDMNFFTHSTALVSSQTVLGLALIVPHPEKPLCLGQTRTVDHSAHSSNWDESPLLQLQITEILHEWETAVFRKVLLPCWIQCSKLRQLAFCFKFFSIQPFGLKDLSF